MKKLYSLVVKTRKTLKEYCEDNPNAEYHKANQLLDVFLERKAPLEVFSNSISLFNYCYNLGYCHSENTTGGNAVILLDTINLIRNAN